MQNTLVRVLKDQFESSFIMLTRLIGNCDEATWRAKCPEAPFWLAVYHVVFYIDYWFRDSYDGGEFRSMRFDARIAPELDAPLFDGLLVSRDEMRAYCEAIHLKTERIFASLTDERLSGQIIDAEASYTVADMVIGQIRHIMYNIGHLNVALKANGLPASEWYAYNEPEGS